MRSLAIQELCLHKDSTGYRVFSCCGQIHNEMNCEEIDNPITITLAINRTHNTQGLQCILSKPRTCAYTQAVHCPNAVAQYSHTKKNCEGAGIPIKTFSFY